jgi:hypothetical protein
VTNSADRTPDDEIPSDDALIAAADAGRAAWRDDYSDGAAKTGAAARYRAVARLAVQQRDAAVEASGVQHITHDHNCRFTPACQHDRDAIASLTAQYEAREAELLKLLDDLHSWVDNWSPDLADDPEWGATEARVRAALSTPSPEVE